ncbi:MAG: hypothetical protein KME31_13875 [Tolypothrix carrinoi HA7290-LM1]|nr:hypothetical protein [Tolypothrix carrinoi HA7290-LM1]
MFINTGRLKSHARCAAAGKPLRQSLMGGTTADASSRRSRPTHCLPKTALPMPTHWLGYTNEVRLRGLNQSNF